MKKNQKSKKYFGTDGIRGKTNQSLINEKFLSELSIALSVFFGKNKSLNKKIIIGKDTRLSSYMVESIITGVMLSRGWNCVSIGVIPTSAISRAIKIGDFDFGIMISASHNSFEDNGIKIFNKKGEKLTDNEELQIEEIISLKKQSPLCTGLKIGRIQKNDDIYENYKKYLLSTIPKKMNFSGLKVVVDCANGSAYKVAPEIFSEVGINLIRESVKPDGKNINKKCGALFPKNLSKLVKNHKADLGISFDGDSDRLIVCDKNGQIINGDKILAIAASSMLKQKKLRSKAIVSTKMANIGLEDYLNKRGIRLFLTDVGDRYVMKEMKRRNVNLGGEQSGHLIFSDHSFTGDGILSALQVFTILQIENKEIHELLDDFNIFPQTLVNLDLHSDTKKIFLNSRLNKTILNFLDNKQDEPKILIRKSGTENLLRIMVQSRSLKLTNHISQTLVDMIKGIDGI